MSHSPGSKFVLPLLLLFASAGIAVAQQKPAAASQEKRATTGQEKNGTSEAALPPGNSADGAKMYGDYCTGCHGPGGLGNGPAASVLNTKPPDLTTLARRHNGKFPVEYVAKVLRQGVNKAAHGTSDMPIWGPIFSETGSSHRQAENKSIANMISYLESIQKSPKK